MDTVAITESPRIVAIAPGGDVILAGTVAVNVDVPVLCRNSSRKDQEGGYREELHFGKSCDSGAGSNSRAAGEPCLADIRIISSRYNPKQPTFDPSPFSRSKYMYPLKYLISFLLAYQINQIAILRN